jgi:hypothetical protein
MTEEANAQREAEPTLPEHLEKVRSELQDIIDWCGGTCQAPDSIWPCFHCTRAIIALHSLNEHIAQAKAAEANLAAVEKESDRIATAVADKVFDESDDDFFEQFDGEGRYRTTWTKDDFVAELRSILAAILPHPKRKGS